MLHLPSFPIFPVCFHITSPKTQKQHWQTQHHNTTQHASPLSCYLPCHQHHHPLSERQPCAWWVHLPYPPRVLTLAPDPIHPQERSGLQTTILESFSDIEINLVWVQGKGPHTTLYNSGSVCVIILWFRLFFDNERGGWMKRQMCENFRMEMSLKSHNWGFWWISPWWWGIIGLGRTCTVCDTVKYTAHIRWHYTDRTHQTHQKSYTHRASDNDIKRIQLEEKLFIRGSNLVRVKFFVMLWLPSLFWFWLSVEFLCVVVVVVCCWVQRIPDNCRRRGRRRQCKFF